MKYYKTRTIYKFPYSLGGIMFWLAEDLGKLRELIQEEIDNDFSKRTDEYLETLSRYGNLVEKIEKSDIYYDMDDIMSFCEEVHKRNSEKGLIFSYIEY